MNKTTALTKKKNNNLVDDCKKLSVDIVLMKALELDVNDKPKSYGMIAEELHCHKSYVGRFLKPFQALIRAYHMFRDNPAEYWRFKEYIMLQHVDIDKIKGTGLKDLIISAGIARDKVRKEEGHADSTVMIGVVEIPAKRDKPAIKINRLGSGYEEGHIDPQDPGIVDVDAKAVNTKDNNSD